MTAGFALPLGEVPAVAERRTIPFDYAFRFGLTGTQSRSHVRKVTVSVEAAFTAVSVGYGVVPAAQPVRFGPDAVDGINGGGVPTNLLDVRLADLFAALGRLAGSTRESVFAGGFRLTPEFAGFALRGEGTGTIQPGVMRELFQAVAAPADRIQFTYALFDDGSGREFQSDPVLNIAGLGTANGERPFYHFARPITFAPLSVIRMEIVELSTVPGELHVSLHGYKVLGSAGTPTGQRVNPRRARRR